MLFKSKDALIEAKDWNEAKKILKTDQFKAYEKPSKKAFMMWCWLRCDRKDGKLMKIMLGQPAPFMAEYRNDPNIVRRELAKATIRLNEWVMLGEKEYDQEKHSEFFYRKDNLA